MPDDNTLNTLLDNAVLMTVDDLSNLAKRANRKPDPYTLSDAISGLVAVAVIGGMAATACYGVRSLATSSVKKTAEQEARVSELRAQLETLKAETGKA